MTKTLRAHAVAAAAVASLCFAGCNAGSDAKSETSGTPANSARADAGAKPGAPNAIVALPDEKGVLPTAASDGHALNMDFEAGDLKDWTATGAAFSKQPVKGDVVNARRSDMHSKHAGDFWVGSYENGGDKPTGTLTSAPFTLNHRYASFLVGGGSTEKERVEIVRQSDNMVIYKTSGADDEAMARAVADLEKFQGVNVFVRLVDEETVGWGHINFDDFKLYDVAPKATVKGKEKPNANLPNDIVKNAGLKPEEAAKAMTLPDGFSVTLCAGEPDVVQPVAMAIDDRGRVWVAEAMNYPVKAPEGQGKDKILIFEDTDGDGKFDKRTVFAEGLNLVSGLEVGFDGVYVGAAPQLLFIPDKNHDDKPDSDPVVLLDGFGINDTHETLNAFNWGPDGWLYGCHGVFTYSNVGAPGTPKEKRVPINAGIWRFHPVTHQFEVFGEGTSNPWGVDFNDYGQAFCTACVIPHLWHIIDGARYQRQGGHPFNPYTYTEIQTIADHVHWIGAAGPHAGNNKSDSMGGGHAHCGAMIYLGGNWPAEYRNQIFMSNIHGNRINEDLLVPEGSGYVGKHGKDFSLTNDKWSRLISLRYGPDGSVYAIDWYDAQACHLPQPEKWDRSNGRIYKYSYKTAQPVQVDLAKMTDAELIAQQDNQNDWYVRHARRLLQERAAAGKLDAKTLPALTEAMKKAADPTRKLRCLWALWCTDGIDEAGLRALLADGNEYVRAWAIQFLSAKRTLSPEVAGEFAKLAAADPSPVVRLYLASAMTHVPLEQRWDVVKALVSHAEDAKDHNLPSMYWYAMEPLVGADHRKGLLLAVGSKVPLLRELAAKRIATKDSAAASAN